MSQEFSEEDDEYQKRFDQAFAALPIEYREVLLLAIRDDLSYEAIAEKLRLSVPAVKTRLHRARARLPRRS